MRKIIFILCKFRKEIFYWTRPHRNSANNTLTFHITVCVLHALAVATYMLVFVQRARYIKFRKGEGVAGYFADLGDLYIAYHLWGKYSCIMWHQI